MRHFSSSVEIHAPPERVWAVMSDIERWSEWTPSVRSIRQLDRGPLAVGVRAWVRQPKLPPALWTVSEIEAGRSFTWVSKAPGLVVIARHGVAAAETGTLATLSLEFRGVLGGWFGSLTRGINTRYLGWEATGLKQRSEAA